LNKRNTCHLGSGKVIYIPLSYKLNVLQHMESLHVLGTPTPMATKPLTQRYPPLFMELQEPQHQTRQKVLHLVGTEL